MLATPLVGHVISDTRFHRGWPAGIREIGGNGGDRLDGRYHQKSSIIADEGEPNPEALNPSNGLWNLVRRAGGIDEIPQERRARISA